MQYKISFIYTHQGIYIIIKAFKLIYIHQLTPYLNLMIISEARVL